MAASELYQKGQEMRRQLLGEAYAERVNQTTYNDPLTSRPRRSSAPCGPARASISRPAH